VPFSIELVVSAIFLRQRKGAGNALRMSSRALTEGIHHVGQPCQESIGIDDQGAAAVAIANPPRFFLLRISRMRSTSRSMMVGSAARSRSGRFFTSSDHDVAIAADGAARATLVFEPRPDRGHVLACIRGARERGDGALNLAGIAQAARPQLHAERRRRGLDCAQVSWPGERHERREGLAGLQDRIA
jgi:hypothetical protein